MGDKANHHSLDTSWLEELQNIVQANGDGITQKSTNRLMITAMIQIVKSINGVEELLTVKLEEMEHTLIEKNALRQEAFATQDDLEELREEMQETLAIRVGRFVEKQPKWAVAIFIIAILLVNNLIATSVFQWIAYLIGLPVNLIP